MHSLIGFVNDPPRRDGRLGPEDDNALGRTKLALYYVAKGLARVNCSVPEHSETVVSQSLHDDSDLAEVLVSVAHEHIRRSFETVEKLWHCVLAPLATVLEYGLGS